jgi:outer membrane lipopolysaccharide assembly protein LptE/RlpB
MPVLIASLGCLSGCGYHTVGSGAHLPASLHSVDVPFFDNETQYRHTEVAMTQAVIRELDTRTRLAVVSGPGGDADATLHGAVLTETVIPYTYNVQNGQSASYLVTIVANVTLTDRSGRVLYRHNGYTFHAQYEATSDLASFIEEDGPAVQRLSRDFAQTLVSDMLESF